MSRAYLAFTAKGEALAHRMAEALPGSVSRCGGDVTLKKAILKDDKTLWDWINQVKMNIIRRESVTIALIDESGIPVQSWKLTNAWPQKYTMEGFKADGSGVSMENIVLAHESITPD